MPFPLLWVILLGLFWLSDVIGFHAFAEKVIARLGARRLSFHGVGRLGAERAARC